MVQRGFVVLPVKLDDWLKRLQTDAEDCLYPGSDIEGIAKEAQRSLQLQDYFHPVVVGEGAGGLLAYAAVADSPDATMAGGIAITPAATLATTLPICDGAKSTKTDSGYSYDLSAELPEPFRIVAADRPTGMSDAHHRAHFIQAGDPPAQIAAAVDASADLADRDATAMPVIVAKAQGTPKAVAIFFSGDGGWRDLDKSIGDWLSQNGVEVLGVDSLRYFWSEKSPQQMGDDIGAILDNAMVPDGIPVAMMGYSFGADTLPFAWNSIPAGWRDRTSIIALLAPSLETGFEISIGGWFGMSTGEKPVVPQIAALPADKVLCVFGEEEGADSACTQPELARLRKIQTTGGHHFDGDYDALAARLLAAMTGAGT
ncbi:hypothetical protein LA66_04720 [Aureimonas altamirensis]|uniref:Bacterial virulence domain-containing protein n=2 Tax=Aureimonas altamirensis TaxID=370622 RepID=A0A0B1Q4Z6_9HYPH|nr:hypothetical protein LA66_04720 [Aureimonas altamirensis]